MAITVYINLNLEEATQTIYKIKKPDSEDASWLTFLDHAIGLIRQGGRRERPVQENR